MDMKKILQAIDGVSAKSVQGANDMKKFVSIIRESASPKSVNETVISSFEAGSVGGDANEFLLAADKINDEVMAQVERIKINADEALLRDMMDKFNNFMTSYHAVGKDILQPDMFNDSMGENTEEQVDEAGAFRRPGSPTAYDRDYASSVSGMGKKDSLAYQQDGGANDEGETDEPYRAPQDKPKMTGMFFYNVQPGQEQEAASLGVKKTKSGKWAKTKYNTSGRSFGMQKDLADKAFGAGKWWTPKTEGVAEGEQRMSRAAKGHEKYGKDGMKALAKAGREGASEEKLDKIRDKHDKYDSKVDETAKKGLYYNVNKRKAAGTSRPASSSKAPTAQAWKDAAKTAKKESVREGLSFTDYVNLAESKQLSKK